MSTLSLITLPNPLLRQKTTVVKTTDIVNLQSLIDDMIETMYSSDGIGIAAPQVGQSIRLVIIHTDKGALPLINPLILKHSHKTEISEEGCLSVPGIFGLVHRYTKIKIAAQNRHGEKIRFDATHLFARIIQHEIDHIDGILFIDKMEKKTSKKGGKYY